jgi:uncharacterized protein (DUF362 family)
METPKFVAHKPVTGRKWKVGMVRIVCDLSAAIRSAMGWSEILEGVGRLTRVVLKPNFIYPYHKPGVTTTPVVIRETVKILRDFTDHVAIVETDGGYGAWQATEAFAAHGMYELRKEFGVEIVNLNDEPRELISFHSGQKTCRLPLPTRLLKETDLFISMPVPKIHCMTGLTLSYKNQWDCVPDIMRLRQHYVFMVKH